MQEGGRGCLSSTADLDRTSSMDRGLAEGTVSLSSPWTSWGRSAPELKERSGVLGSLSFPKELQSLGRKGPSGNKKRFGNFCQREEQGFGTH